MQLLGSLRAGPTLLAMGFATLLALSDRRRTFPTFFGAALLFFALFWFVTGQALSNLGEYIVNTAEVVGGYSASMVFHQPVAGGRPPPSSWPRRIAGLCVVIGWRRDNMRRIGFLLMIAAVTFLSSSTPLCANRPAAPASSGRTADGQPGGCSLCAPQRGDRRGDALVAFAYISNHEHISTP